MELGILLYPDFTALDAIGPYEVLSRMPGARLRFVAEEAGPVRSDTGFLQIVAEAALGEVDALDLLLVPGGPGDEAARGRAELLAWVRRIHEGTRFTTSVCTGSLILAAAGLLEGQPAVTHWTQMETLRELGAEPREARFVESGRILTAAGVSAGIDMALHLLAQLAGEDFAQAIQLGIEYDPQPPFDAGSPGKAPAPAVELVRAAMSRS